MSDSLHLICRDGVWYYRRRVPEHAQASIGTPFVQRSLKTSSKPEAKKLRETLDVHWSAEFERARRTAGDLRGIVPNGRTLTVAGAVQLVRDYVERLDKRSHDRQLTDSPESEGQRAEIVADIECEA